jgi:putative SOS response-associated peptidase YedK
MCNLYNITTTHEAILQWSRAMYDRAGNLEPSLDVYPNYKAPVVRAAADGEREIVRLNWGMPSPPDRVKGKADYGSTNIRRPNFGHWRQWLGVEHRCIVPATSFAEPSPTPGDKDPATGNQRNFWFAVDETSRCSSSPASGRAGTAFAASRMAHRTTNFSAFSPPSRTVS